MAARRPVGSVTLSACHPLVPVLGLSPPLALLAAAILIHKWRGFAGIRGIAVGAACGLAAIMALALPAIEVRLAADMVRSERVWVQEMGFRILGLDAVKAELLRASSSVSSGSARESIALLTGRGPLPWNEARELYYQATGVAFDSEPVSQWHRRSGLVFDANRGGDRVGSLAEGVRLAESRIDGSVDPRSEVAYLEWTLVFHNSSGVQQEARAEMALPRGGVVSRATLWIHGTEREATFGERGQVRQAYESVVRARRDPLLVTTVGQDRVQVQCFPIEPGGDMKIRVGITAPVVPEEMSDAGFVVLPHLLARNFDAAERSSVWVESNAPLVPTGGHWETSVRDDAVHVIHGALRNDERVAVRMLGLTWGKTWAPEEAAKGPVVEQSFVERPIAPPERAVVVVDGSESMRAMRDEIGQALATIPGSIETRVIVATRTGVKDWSAAKSWTGGVDAAPALEKALRILSGAQRGAVVWIAGEQDVRMGGTERIRQRLERDGGRVQLAVLACAGRNAVIRDLDGLRSVQPVVRLGSVSEDLRRFFARWRGGASERIAQRQVTQAAAKDAERGSAHIVRLWAADEVSARTGHHRADAVALAVEHQIVTPLSGAVVLETAAQYSQHGLQPASGSAVPTMPEPETWALLAVGLGVLAIFLWRRRYSTGAHR